MLEGGRKKETPIEMERRVGIRDYRITVEK